MPDRTQYGESRIIDDFLDDRVGAFLDIGAHAAKENSNTRALADRGWSGVCVEPSPKVFPDLLATYAGNHRIRCLNAAIAAESKVIRFWDANGDQLATASLAHLEKWRKLGYPFSEMFLCTVTFDQLLAAFDGPFNFLSIDTEGTSLEVLRAAPLARMGVELVCVENDPGVTVELERMGLRIIGETPGNVLAAR